MDSTYATYRIGKCHLCDDLRLEACGGMRRA